MIEALVFWTLAIGMIGTALSVVLQRGPVGSALSLVLTFLFLAGLYITMEAFFLAMVQIIVYAGAVMVLFLFIIMLLDLKEDVRRPFPWVKMLMVAVLVSALGLVFWRVLADMRHGHMPLVWGVDAQGLTAKDLGRELFTRYLLPFEVTAVLLLVATIGVVHLSRRLDTADRADLGVEPASDPSREAQREGLKEPGQS
ncbi:MAG: NADH-quinone oxidoreductase subunit J [Candidatus Methylacidiphilales bacterium]